MSASNNVQGGKAFREYFLEDRPDLRAELESNLKVQINEWFESDDWQKLRERSRDKWLKVGIDIDVHKDSLVQLHLLLAKASPEYLRVALNAEQFNDRPPSEWFEGLFESAVQEQERRRRRERSIKTSEGSGTWTQGMELEGRRILQSNSQMCSNDFVRTVGGNRRIAQALFRHITGKAKRRTRTD